MKVLRSIFRFLIGITVGRKTAMYWLASNSEGKLLNFLDAGYLYENGWFRSLEENRSVNLKGEAIAWLPYSLLRFLNDRLQPHLTILEYGAGASSFYFAARVKAVVSVENNRSWYEHILANKPQNLTLVLAENEDTYVRAGGPVRKFDFILVDGDFREACLRKGIEYLSDAGVILLDDTNAPEFNSLIPNMTQLGFKHLRFNDFAPIISYNKESTLFYRDGNCLGL